MLIKLISYIAFKYLIIQNEVDFSFKKKYVSLVMFFQIYKSDKSRYLLIIKQQQKTQKEIKKHVPLEIFEWCFKLLVIPCQLFFGTLMLG